MRIAITGSTGFIGSHLAQRLATAGHELVLIARSERGKETIAAAQTKFVASDLSNAEVLVEAFAGCDAVAHCAGINREIGEQTYLRVHVEATKNVVAAAKQAGVRKVALMSFLRARPDCGSAYHESKWAAEEIVRNSSLDYTILKSGMVYGLGDPYAGPSKSRAAYVSGLRHGRTKRERDSAAGSGRPGENSGRSPGQR